MITMTVERAIRLTSSTLVLLTVAVAHPKCPLYVSENMLFVTAFIAVMLIQSVFTGFCPMALVFKKMGLKSAGE
jgi:hypothetical protein